MSRIRILRMTAGLCVVACFAISHAAAQRTLPDTPPGLVPNPGLLEQQADEDVQRSSAIFAGGCFWCVETDFESLPGVVNVISGYTGGRTKQPTYANYASGGHREAVFVVYDSSQISYAGLVEFLIKHIDPTDRGGSFNDRGRQYSPAIYYENAEEKAEAERVIQAIDETHKFPRKLGVAVESRTAFWPAEDAHQDYHVKNGLKYAYYRAQSGRDAFVQKHWGQSANILELPGATPSSSELASTDDVKGDKRGGERDDLRPWEQFQKPSDATLREQLNNLQYNVTQHEATEPAFRNTYWKNKQAGIYVDIVSGEPLFTSAEKYESGTGWPSFVKPINPDYIVYREDRGIFSTRIEVRSRFGDSHLGHVFTDGPPERGGKRYCMNSAAMRFIPKERMKDEGYADYLPLIESSERLAE